MGRKIASNPFNLVKLVGATAIGVMSVAQAAVAQVQPAAQPTAQAQTPAVVVAESRGYVRSAPEVRPLPTVPEAFNRAYYSHTGNFFDNRGIVQGLRLIFGVPNFVDNSISQDGRAVNRIYREALKQQVASDPVLRTPDLPNPYTGSVLTTPLVITEEPIAPAPPFPPIQRPGYAEPAPVAPPAQPRRPVPALW